MAARRCLAATTSGFILAGVLLPGAALAAPGAPPTTVADTITTNEGVIATGNVLTNDSNPGEGTLTVTGTGPLSPTVGTLVIASNGDYTFTPAPDWFGTARTTYDVANARHTRTAAITINVTNVNDAPTANNETITVSEDVATDVTAAILANDTDPDNDTLAVSSVSNATGGSAVLASGSVTFTGDPNACGTAFGGFDYQVSDGNGGFASAHATVDVTCVNDDPVAVDDGASGTEDTDVVITAADLATNDTDAEGDSLTVTAVANPSNGSVNLAAGTITFTPDADVCGASSAGFDYTVEDGNGGSATGHVAIDLTCVNETPVAGDDTISGNEDTAISATSGDLTANDTDGDNDPLAVTGVSNATGGQVALDGDTVTFTPDANACGPATGTFEYTVEDGNGGSDTGLVTVDVTCVNDDPAPADDTASGTEDGDVVITAADLATNDTDAEGDSLAVTGVSNATGGSVALAAGTITFTPDANLCGTAVAGFDYAVEDGNGGSATGHVTISLGCVNDDPTAGDDGATITEDTATDVTAGLLDNDDDIDGDTLAFGSVDNATGGSVALAAGAITFTPGSNLCGSGAAGFDYTVEDGNGGSATAHVTIDITCVNDAPTATADSVGGTEDTGVAITASDLATNDGDVDGDAKTVSGVSGATGGSVALAAGTITFTPTANLCGTGAAGFDYTVEDGNGGSAIGHVTIDLTCVNDAPTAGNDSATVLGNSGPADHAVLGNDADVDGDTLSVVSASVASAAGTVSVVGNNVRFTPATGWTGEAAISYTISDGALQASATLTVTVGGDVTAPLVARATVAFATGRVDETAPLRITWSATDASSGVASYEVQVSVAGGAFKSVYKGAGTSIVKFYSFNKTLVWRVRATDVAGNTSGWVNSAKRTITPVQNSSTRNVYRGAWRNVDSLASSGRGYAYTATRGDRITLSFSGRSVLYVAPRTAKSGWAKVYVDGKLIGRFNLYRSSTALGRIIARASWSANGTHTIRVVNDQGGKRTNFDAFIILR
ncbi:MAG TPA: Ig-like domain-containing protein [Candidatus Limnocylindrales bacterium]